MATNALVLVVALALGLTGALGAQFIVGDSAGWSDPSQTNVSFAEWALQHRFHVGDTLVFKYSHSSHTVLKVNRQDFEACHTSNSMAAYKDGESVVHLTTPGPHWFICGEAGHCAQGQKFGVMVVERRSHHKSPAPAPGLAPVASSEEFPSPSASPVAAPALAPSTGGASRAVVSAVAGGFGFLAVVLATVVV